MPSSGHNFNFYNTLVYFILHILNILCDLNFYSLSGEYFTHSCTKLYTSFSIKKKTKNYYICYAPKQQGKFLVCEILLGKKPDCDSINFLSHLLSTWALFDTQKTKINFLHTIITRGINISTILYINYIHQYCSG